MTTNGIDSSRADVELRMPADNAYVSVLRSTAATLASRLGFSLEAIEDLRVSVGEACALAVTEAPAGADMTVEFVLALHHLTVVVSVAGPDVRAPDEESFAWQVLATLARSASAEVRDGRLSITLDAGAESAPAPV